MYLHIDSNIRSLGNLCLASYQLYGKRWVPKKGLSNVLLG